MTARSTRAMRVLVLGGSGLIGNAIVRRLIADDCVVTAVGRRRDRPRNLHGVRADYMTGDVGDRGLLDALVESHDAVVDAAAPYPLHLFHAANPSERNPLGHAQARMNALLSSVERHGAGFAYVGTPHVRRTSEPRGAQSRFVQRLQPYFEVKKVLEEQVHEAASRGVQTIIVRPSACFGPWDTKPRAQCWLPALVSGEIPLVLQHRLNVVDSRDVADVVVGALRDASYGADVAVAGHNTSTEELFSVACELAGVSRPRWAVPAELGVFPAMFAELAWALVGNPSPLPSLVLMLLCEQEWTDAPMGAARRPLRDTVRDALAWYRSLGYC